MSDYLKKRQRSQNKQSKSKNKSDFKGKFKSGKGDKKSFGIKISKKQKEELAITDVTSFQSKDMVSEDMVKIGKFWEGSNLIEPKNTSGKLSFFEKDEKSYILSQIGDGLALMETEGLVKVGEIRVSEESVVAFTVNPIKEEVICSMSNSLMRIFHLSNLSKCTKTWKLNKELGKILKMDPSNKFIAMATTRNSIFIYDSENYKLLNNFTGHTGFIYDIAFTPDKEKFLLYSASEDGTVKIWDIILNKNVGTLEGHSNGVRNIVLTNDGKSLISTTTDNQIYVWKLSNKAEQNTLIKSILYDRSITAIIYFTRRNEGESQRELIPSLLIGCEDGSLCEFNLKSGETEENKIVNCTNQSISQIHYSPSNTSLYVLTYEQTIIYLGIDIVHQDISNSSLIKMYPGYCQEVLDIKLLPNSGRSGLEFLFSSNENTLKYYQEVPDSTPIIKAFEGHSDFIMNIDVKDNFISTCSKDNTIRIWLWSYEENENADANEFNCKCIAVLKGHSEAVNSSALMTKKGNFKLVSGGKDSSVKVWDFSEALSSEEANNEPLLIKQSTHSELAHNEEVNVVKISPNEKLVASGSFDKTIKIWSSELKLEGTLTGHKRSVTDFSFSRYAKILASSSTDKTIKIWNLSDFTCINTFEGHLSSVLKVQWVYYGTHILSAGADGLVKFWNLKTSECLNTIDAHEGKIWAMDVKSSEFEKSGQEENETKNETFANSKLCQFITGATDSKISFWTDITVQKETSMLKEEEDTLLKKEELRFLNINKDYYEAMKLALELNHRNEFIHIMKNFISDSLKKEEISEVPQNDQISLIINNRKILEEQMDASVKESRAENVKSDKDQYQSLYKDRLKNILKDQELRKVIKEKLDRVLEITRDNNITSANFLIVQILLKLILISSSHETFINAQNKTLGIKNKNLSKKERKNIDYIDNFNIIKTYSEKHLERINREITKSYLVDFVIEKMKII